MRAGTVIVIVGVVIVAVGLLVRCAPGAVSWFGRLPGDIRFESESTRVYIPIASMLIVSVAISFVLWVVTRVRG